MRTTQIIQQQLTFTATALLAVIFFMAGICLPATVGATTPATASAAATEATVTATGATTHPAGQYSQRLLDLKENIILVNNRNAALIKSHQQQAHRLAANVTEAMRLQADLDVTNAELNLHSSEISLQRQVNDIEAIAQSIRDLEQLLATSHLDPGKLRLELADARSVLQHQHVYHAVLKKYRHALGELLATHKQWQHDLEQAWLIKQQQARDASLQQNLLALKAQRAQWNEKLKERRQQAFNELDKTVQDPVKPQIVSDIALLQAEEKLQLLSQQITVLEIQNLYRKLTQRQEAAKNDLLLVQTLSENIAHLIEAVQNSQVQTVSKLDLLQQYRTILQRNHESLRISKEQLQENDAILQGLLQEYQQQSERQLRLIKDLAGFKISLTEGKQALDYRQALPKNAKQWQVLATSLAYLPTLVLQHLKDEWEQVEQTVSYINSWQLLMLLSAQTVLLLACIFGWRLLRRTLQQKEDSATTFIARLTRFSADSLARNIISFSLLWLVGSLGLLLLITGTTLITVLWVAVIWLVFKFAINTARIILVENTAVISGQDVRLFQLIRATFVIGGILTALLMMTHQLTLPVNVAGTIDRLYMVILLFISYPPLRHAHVVNQLLVPYSADKYYLRKVISISVYLIPATFFSNALIGLAGYINLAWFIGIAEAKIILVACLWLAGKGLLDDILHASSEWFIRRVANGWLITQAVLVPMHLIAVLLLWIAIIVCGLIMFGVTLEAQQAFIVDKIFAITIFNIADSPITGLNILEFLAVLWMVIWASKWSREFSYRWIYNKVKDTGVRDSLSMFTQYGIIVLGFFGILAALGIDLTTLTVVAAALSIGIAFGVRDIVNNILSGLLLLIERPIRKGDWISVMEYEGEVTHIGLRAITVQTGDNREVIVPNTETMIKAFTNWTRCDSVVREEIGFPVAFYDNPEIVCAVMQEAVQNVDGVLSTPPVQALLREVDHGLLHTKIRYHVDMRNLDGRAVIKSRVIKAIWEALVRAGLSLPAPKHSVQLLRN